MFRKYSNALLTIFSKAQVLHTNLNLNVDRKLFNQFRLKRFKLGTIFGHTFKGFQGFSESINTEIRSDTVFVCFYFY